MYIECTKLKSVLLKTSCDLNRKHKKNFIKGISICCKTCTSFNDMKIIDNTDLIKKAQESVDTPIPVRFDHVNNKIRSDYIIIKGKRY